MRLQPLICLLSGFPQGCSHQKLGFLLSTIQRSLRFSRQTGTLLAFDRIAPCSGSLGRSKYVSRHSLVLSPSARSAAWTLFPSKRVNFSRATPTLSNYAVYSPSERRQNPGKKHGSRVLKLAFDSAQTFGLWPWLTFQWAQWARSAGSFCLEAPPLLLCMTSFAG